MNLCGKDKEKNWNDKKKKELDKYSDLSNSFVLRFNSYYMKRVGDGRKLFVEYLLTILNNDTLVVCIYTNTVEVVDDIVLWC